MLKLNDYLFDKRSFGFKYNMLGVINVSEICGDAGSKIENLLRNMIKLKFRNIYAFH